MKGEHARLLAPNDISILFQLGLLYYENNKINKAIDHFERILTLDPGNQQAEQVLANLRVDRKPPVEIEEIEE